MKQWFHYILVTSFLFISINHKAYGAETLEISCIIESVNFPNFENKHNLSGRATLRGPHSSENGRKLVTKQGDFEFWILTKTTRLDPKVNSILSYYAEIKNAKSGFAVRAASPAKQNEGELIEAEVSMVVYKDGNQKTGELRMNCGSVN